jgi:hypothetical protein
MGRQSRPQLSRPVRHKARMDPPTLPQPSSHCQGFKRGPSIVPVPVLPPQNLGLCPFGGDLFLATTQAVPTEVHLRQGGQKSKPCWLRTQPEGWMVGKWQGSKAVPTGGSSLGHEWGS